MPVDQKERSAKTAAKRKAAGEEELRLRVRPGTKQALTEIMQWADVEESGEAMTLLVHRIHELGPEAALHFLSAPRHEIVVSDVVARRLDRFRIGRQMREPILMTGDDSDDAGVCVIEHIRA